MDQEITDHGCLIVNSPDFFNYALAFALSPTIQSENPMSKLRPPVFVWERS